MTTRRSPTHQFLYRIYRHIAYATRIPCRAPFQSLPSQTNSLQREDLSAREVDASAVDPAASGSQLPVKAKI